MRVFITGATGYIGNAAAKAFRAKGHTVYGLVRSEEAAQVLSQDEIWPILGDMNNPSSYEHILDEVEVVVHCAVDTSEKAVELDYKTIETVLNKYSHTSLSKAFIYTSGVWIYGSTGQKIVDEASPLNPLDLVKWRSKHEERVLSAATQNLRTAILRPGCVYGGVGGLMNIFFNSTLNGEVRVIESGKNNWSMVHVKDLAYAYVAAAEKEINRLILNVTQDTPVTVHDIASAIAQAASVPIKSISQDEASRFFGPLVQGLMCDQHVANTRIKRLLGWQIHHAPFIDEVDLYYNAWKAAQKVKEF